MLASVTRLRVQSIRNLPAFLWMTFLAWRQIIHAPGFLGGRLLIDNLRTYWTLSVWESEKSMKAFRGAGPHARVMPKLVEWCDEAALVHWQQETDQQPDWHDAHRRLQGEGRRSKVNHPSPAQEKFQIPAPKLRG